jgi:hypothetical protein|tara:strand:+ start:926 stop:1087 length:162 start_codon:yes stop_codon:yes gene_type:complete
VGKVLLISKELLILMKKWKGIAGDEDYILRSINKHGHIGNNLNSACSISILKN